VKKAQFIVLILITNVGFLLSLSANAAFDSQYVVSPSIHVGTYAKYQVFNNPKVEYMRWVVLSVHSTWVTANVTLTLADQSERSSVINLAVDKTTIFDSYNIVAATLTVNSSSRYTFIAAPLYGFIIGTPLITPFIQQHDFVNVEQRNEQGTTVVGQPIVGYSLTRIAGDIYNYTYRKLLVVDVIGGIGYEWDGETGILLLSNFAPVVRLISTNAWHSPLANSGDFFAIEKFIFGYYFSRWEIWVVTLLAVVIYLALPSTRRYLQDRRALKRIPQVGRVLTEIEKQDKKIAMVISS
jgi:hypothetical protein